MFFPFSIPVLLLVLLNLNLGQDLFGTMIFKLLSVIGSRKEETIICRTTQNCRFNFIQDSFGNIEQPL